MQFPVEYGLYTFVKNIHMEGITSRMFDVGHSLNYSQNTGRFGLFVLYKFTNFEMFKTNIKARFHETTNHADEREKTADDQK